MTALHLRDTGGGTDAGAPIVLAHGVAQDSSIFDAQVAALAGRHRIITWDAPGHGRSPARRGPYTHAALADDLAAALAELGIQRAIVGGSSQGGWVSLHVAARHPELVAGLVLIACSAHPQDPAQVDLVRAGVAGWAAHGASDDYAAYQARSNVGPGSPLTDAWISHLRSLDGAAFVEPYEALLTRPDMVPLLPAMDVPALVIRGEHDPWVPADEAALMATLLPQATLVEIRDGWHTVSVTHPAEVTAALATFLATFA